MSELSGGDPFPALAARLNQRGHLKISGPASRASARASHANGARRRSGARESVWGSPRGEAPREDQKPSQNQRTRVASERASEPRERSAPAKRRARERVGESEGRSPSVRLSARRS